MFVGYSSVHPKGTYCFVNLETHRVVHSRDTRWLNKTWGEWQNIKQQHVIQIRNEESDSDDEEIIQLNESENVLEESTNQGGMSVVAPIRQQGCVSCDLCNLNTFYNVTIPPELSGRDEDEQAELALLGAVDSGFQEPSNFCEAWDHPDEET